MRLRSPAENYVKYLVSHPDKLGTAVVRERLLDDGLDPISDGYIDSIRARMKVPAPFKPADRDHSASFRFIIQEKINRIYQPDIPMKTAWEVLRMPRAKEFAEAMLLVHVPMSAIALFITKHRGVYCTAAALEMYKYYFWNINLLDSTQMRILLEMRIESLPQQVPEFKGRESVLKHAYYKDARKTAADLPFSPLTAMLAQVRLGVPPSRGEIALRLLDAREQSLVRASEAILQNGPNDSQNALNYANTARILGELLQMVAKPEDQMREQLQSIGLRTDTQPMKSIAQLSGGSHTVDVAPLKDPQHDDADEFDPQAGVEDGRG
jgi:hypothetical protein